MPRLLIACQLHPVGMALLNAKTAQRMGGVALRYINEGLTRQLGSAFIFNLSQLNEAGHDL